MTNGSPQIRAGILGGAVVNEGVLAAVVKELQCQTLSRLQWYSDGETDGFLLPCSLYASLFHRLHVVGFVNNYITTAGASVPSAHPFPL